MIKAHVLTFQRYLKMASNPFPPPLAQLHRAWALTHVGKYTQIMCALAMSTSMVPSNESTTTF
jgi:hypothetical protein